MDLGVSATLAASETRASAMGTDGGARQIAGASAIARRDLSITEDPSGSLVSAIWSGSWMKRENEIEKGIYQSFHFVECKCQRLPIISTHHRYLSMRVQ
jgi:hypothetical protein